MDVILITPRFFDNLAKEMFQLYDLPNHVIEVKKEAMFCVCMYVLILFVYNVYKYI